MGMREYNADNKTTRLVGKWEFRKGGYSNDADLEKSSARQLSLRANVQRPGRETNSEPEPHGALYAANVRANVTPETDKRL